MVHNKNNTILKMIKGEETTHTPVWFMRQAGRSQPEYRKLKEKYSLFDITHQPELCAYVTHLPVDNYHTDAAILYKDIMTPLKPIGVDVEIKSGIGPWFALMNHLVDVSVKCNSSSRSRCRIDSNFRFMGRCIKCRGLQTLH